MAPTNSPYAGESGYAVALAATFEEAKAILEQEGETLDAAVIEVCLDECDFSNEDGMRLAEHIVNAGQQISVIMLTGHGTVDRCRRAFRDLNVFDFLQKERVDFPGGFIDILAQAAEHK